MKKSQSIIEIVKSLYSLTQDLFIKIPSLFLVVIYLVDLGIRSYLAEGFSTILLLGVMILLISICIYVSTKSFSETTLSFILGILTMYSINWEVANFNLFIFLYLIYIIIIFYTYAIRLTAKQENILRQAACKLDIDDFNEVYKRLKRISVKPSKRNQLSIIERSEIIRYLAFRQVIIGEYEESIDVIELIKNVCQIDLIRCCEFYYSLYVYCSNRKPVTPNLPRNIEKMFDRITTVTVSYNEFFEIFIKTKRILVEDRISFDEYLLEIKLLSLKGYSSEDIIELLINNYLQ